MNTDLFAGAADFPACWLEHGLLSGEFFVQQIAAFEAEYGATKPNGGTEHWRYAAFLHWLRTDLDTQRLAALLTAALADPDPPMAGNVLKAIVARPNCTQAMLKAAQDRVGANADYYVSAEGLCQAFESTQTRREQSGI